MDPTGPAGVRGAGSERATRECSAFVLFSKSTPVGTRPFGGHSTAGNVADGRGEHAPGG